MSERLHYFAEASTPVSFDCSDSDIDSDLDDSRRPISPTDRAKQHARQLQLWSDEARRRRRTTLPSSASLDGRTRPPADRQQSNLSERARLVGSSRHVARSNSAKNLRIRVTPSSSSKSLLSDVSDPAMPSAPVSVNLLLPTSSFSSTPNHPNHLNKPKRTMLRDPPPLEPTALCESRRRASSFDDGLPSAPHSDRMVHVASMPLSTGAAHHHATEEPFTHNHLSARRSTTARRMSRPFTRLVSRKARSSGAAADSQPSSRNLNRRLSFSRTVKRLSISRFFRR